MKLTSSNLLDFRRKPTKRGKQGLLSRIATPKPKDPDDTGGDYWTSAVSAIVRSYKARTLDDIRKTAIERWDAYHTHPNKVTKLQFERNAKILDFMVEFDYDQVRPSSQFQVENGDKKSGYFLFDDQQIKCDPSVVFSYDNGIDKVVGSVWFKAKKGGLPQEELGMLAEISYLYLKRKHGQDVSVDPEQVYAVDIENGNFISYARVLSRDVPSALAKTVADINNL